ncbi:MAG: 7-cyano-7-deazaguanine synthase [Patescibacteria group bacterium]|nr:MAG: 7-cyano-7-deazaguanine synthase [Patescibacteria group bacterium]
MRALVLVSGGLDSGVLLAYCKETYPDDYLLALSFAYPSRHNYRESDAAENLCKHYNVSRFVVDVSGLLNLVRGKTALLVGGMSPNELDKSYPPAGTIASFVPGRNLIFIAAASMVAIKYDCDKLFVGYQSGDCPNYPDCSPDFINAMKKAVNLTADGKLELDAPFIGLSKCQVVKVGADLKFPFELSWSCYKDYPTHCGVCAACRERKKAFLEAGISDPTTYSD